MDLSRGEIECAIRNNKNTVELVANSSSKSAVWNTFKLIKCEQKFLDYVCCTGCKTVLAYQKKNGTGTLSRHKCSRGSAASGSQPRIDNYALKSIPEATLKNFIYIFLV